MRLDLNSSQHDCTDRNSCDCNFEVDGGFAAQEAEGGGDAKDRLINAVGFRQGGVPGDDAAEAPCCHALPDCRSQDQFFEELLRLPPPVGRSRCP